VPDQSLVPVEAIVSKILFLRGEKVLLDRDLAELCGVETKQLKRAVRRDLQRFPKDFMFELTSDEVDSLRRHFATLSWGGASITVRRSLSRWFKECTNCATSADSVRGCSISSPKGGVSFWFTASSRKGRRFRSVTSTLRF